MGITSPIIKQIHDKLDELRDVNALVEQAKVAHETITKASEARIAAAEEREKQAQEVHAQVEKERAELEASIDRTHLKLAESVTDLNKRFDSLTTDIAIKEDISKSLDHDIDRKKNMSSSLDIDIEDKEAKLLSLNTDLGLVVNKINSQEEVKNRNSELIATQTKRLKEMGDEEQAWQQRKHDLELYADRIKKYYADQGINIEL